MILYIKLMIFFSRSINILTNISSPYSFLQCYIMVLAMGPQLNPVLLTIKYYQNIIQLGLLFTEI